MPPFIYRFQMRLLVASVLLGLGSAHQCYNDCEDYQTSDAKLKDFAKPVFGVFLPKRPEFEQIDNICFTTFYLPDTPDSALTYQSEVYCDGSHKVISLVSRQLAPGVLRTVSLQGTTKRSIFGPTDCGVSVFYACTEFGSPESFAYGVSCHPDEISEACFQSSLELLEAQNIPEEEEYFKLPFNQPTRCIYQHYCVETSQNPFYRHYR